MVRSKSIPLMKGYHLYLLREEMEEYQQYALSADLTFKQLIRNSLAWYKQINKIKRSNTVI